jgi:hypothetical protein
MITKTMLKLLVLTVVVVSAPQFAVAQSQNETAPQAKQVAGVRSKDTPSGTVVTITSDELLYDYGAYRVGDSYQILIPQVSLALNNVHVEGSAFSDAKVEAKGTNLVFSFRLRNGVYPSVSQKANQLEITFARVEIASAGPVTTTATVPPLARVQSGRERDSSIPSDGPQLATIDSGSRSTSNTLSGESTSVVSSAAAAPAPTPAKSTAFSVGNITDINVDLAVPDSPAFTVLGITPENVTHPTTPKEFSTSLLNGVDERGNFQTGLALDFVPYLTFFGKDTSLFSYAHSPMERFLARTQVSFATAKGVTDEDKSTRLALGLRMTLWDMGDPRLDGELDTCYKNAESHPDFLTEEYVIVSSDQEPDKQKKKRKRAELYAQVTEKCDVEARKNNWNASGWIVGLAPSWISKTGETKNFEWNGGGFWSTVAYGFEQVKALEDNSQLLFHVRYRNNELVPDAEDPTIFFNQDSLYVGGRLRIAPGKTAKSIFSLEGNYIRSRQDKGSWDNSRRFSLGLERRIAENIWFALSVGGQGGRIDGANHAFVLSSFKWGFQQKNATP